MDSNENFCEQGNEPTRFHNNVIFFDQMRHFKFSEKDQVSYLVMFKDDLGQFSGPYNNMLLA